MVIRLRARNAIGLAEKYEKDTKIRVTMSPHQMETPVASTFTPNSMTLSWEKLQGIKTGGTPITSYEVMRDEGSGYKRFVKTLLNETIIENAINGKIYKFKVRGENVIGKGQYSEELTQRMPTKPAVPEFVTKNGTCGLILEWPTPDNDG